MTSSDEDLCRAWSTGDGGSGQTLVKRHYASVDRFFRTKVGDQRCVDLTQATFLAAQEGISRFRGESKFRTWLFGIARNKLLVHLRDHRDWRIDTEEHSVEDAGFSPSTIIDRNQRIRLLLEALRRLPVDDQLMLELHYWEHIKVAEIAAIVEKPENTVKTRMKRAREQLYKLMGELAKSQEELETTRSGLDGWAERVRHECEDDSEADASPPTDGETDD